MVEFIAYVIIVGLLYAVTRWLDKKVEGRWKNVKFSEVLIIIFILYLTYMVQNAP